MMNTVLIASLARQVAHLEKRAGLEQLRKGIPAAGKLIGTGEKTMGQISGLLKETPKTMFALGPEHEVQSAMARRLGPAAQLGAQSNQRALSAANAGLSRPLEHGALGAGLPAEGRLLSGGSEPGLSGSAKALLGTVGVGAAGLGGLAAYGASRPPAQESPQSPQQAKSQLAQQAFGGGGEGEHEGGPFGGFRDMYENAVINAHQQIGQRRMSQLQQMRSRLQEMEGRFRTQGFGNHVPPSQMSGMNPYMAYNG